MSKYMQMQKVTYYINNKQHMLRKVEVDYIPDTDIQRIVYEFEEQIADYKKEDMKIPVSSLVLEKSGELQKKYAGYKLIDTRKK